ncbi:MAG: hypothetical protein KA313_04620, partial [Pseudarcicella sp.]|nr:hypothetical protein [Pseudarcicella sp.]MBP6410363.1 hypothetical protein [Pseudarcicella sp.]
LPKDDEYGYNRYLDSLHHKASEIFTLENEAKHKAKEEGKIEGKIEGEYNKAIEIAIKLLESGATDEFIQEITQLSIEEIKKLRDNYL